MLEGLRLRMEGGLRTVDRGSIFAAARHALSMHQWLVEPDFDQEREVQRAERALQAVTGTPLLAAARWLHDWLDAGEDRAPARAALVRYWRMTNLLAAPVPLIGAKALRPGIDWRCDVWTTVFLDALADEAAAALQLLLDLERAWLSARAAVAGRRRHSRAAGAVDLLAASPLLSASTLAAGLGMTVKNAGLLLGELCAAGIAVEVTHRSARRLYGLAGLAPLRDEVAPPRRPVPGRGRGRPPIPREEVHAPLHIPPPMTPFERRSVDYSDLEAAIAAAEETIRRTRRNLAGLTTAASADGVRQTPAGR